MIAVFKQTGGRNKYAMFRFEEADPRYLVVYDSDAVADITNYQAWLSRWVARLEHGERFGVIWVTQEHHHEDDDHHHERDAAFEEAYSKLVNDFRREYKHLTEQYTVGFARVLPLSWIEAQRQHNPNYLASAHDSTNRMARYMWGIAGGLFGDESEAQAWLEAQFDAPTPSTPAPPHTPIVATPTAQQRIGLFYGSTTGVTELIAEHIQAAWADLGLAPLTAHNIGMVKDVSALLSYDILIIGVSTWNIGQLQDDWDIVFPQLDSLDFSGKHIALFGAGDQYNYPDNFLDAIGILGEKFQARGASLVGFWDAQGYEFSESRALLKTTHQFMGLGIDEVHQADQTADRVRRWVAQLAREFALQPHPTVIG